MLDFATSGYAPSFSQQKHSGKRATSGNVQNPCSVCQPSQEGRTSQPRGLSLEGFCGSSCHCGEGLAISSGTVSVPSISVPATDSRGLDSWLCWAVSLVWVKESSFCRESQPIRAQETHETNLPAQSLPKQQIPSWKEDSSWCSSCRSGTRLQFFGFPESSSMLVWGSFQRCSCFSQPYYKSPLTCSPKLSLSEIVSLACE